MKSSLAASLKYIAANKAAGVEAKDLNPIIDAQVKALCGRFSRISADLEDVADVVGDIGNAWQFNSAQKQGGEVNFSSTNPVCDHWICWPDD